MATTYPVRSTSDAGALSRASSTNLGHSGAGSFTSHGGGFRGGTTWQEILWLPCGVDAVQICPLCDIADVSLWAGQKFSVQATDGGTDLQNPWQGGTRLPLVPVTFGGAASPTFTAASPDLPSGPWSDWMPVANLGSGVSALLIRQWAPGTNTNQNGSYNGEAISGATRLAKLAALGVKASFGFNGTDVTGNNTATITASLFGMPILVRFATRRKVPTVWQYGDSTKQGYYGAGVVEAVERWAISESLAGRPVAVSNRAEQSQSSLKYFARLKAAVDGGDRCDVLNYQVATINDMILSDTIAKIIARAHQAIGLADKMGATIVLHAPMPWSTGTPNGSEQAILNGARQFCLDMTGKRDTVKVVHFDGLHDPAQYGKWIAAYNYNSDGAHPNELAVTSAILPSVAAVMREAVGA